MTDNEGNKPILNDSDCLQAMDHLYAYLSGELYDNTTREMIEHHLGHCKSCYSRAEIEREINQRLQSSKDVNTPESLKKRLKSILKDI